MAPGDRETALITGASSGIGLELAHLFARDGAELVLVARSRERLEALAGELRRAYGTSAHTLCEDLSDPAAPPRILDSVRERGFVIDVLVNNAGIGARGQFAALDLERQLAMLQVNLCALTHLSRLFLPPMLARRRGAILNVGSIASFLPGPGMAVYYATKAYVLSFTEALAEEVRGSGVRVTLLAPGPTATGFARTANMENSKTFAFGVMKARDVARAGYAGMRKGQVIVVPGIKSKISSAAVRFIPRALVRRVVRWLQT